MSTPVASKPNNQARSRRAFACVLLTLVAAVWLACLVPISTEVRAVAPSASSAEEPAPPAIPENALPVPMAARKIESVVPAATSPLRPAATPATTELVVHGHGLESEATEQAADEDSDEATEEEEYDPDGNSEPLELGVRVATTAEDKEQLAGIKQRWETEHEDPAWTEQMRDYADSMLVDLEVAGAVHEVSCRSSLCKTTLSFPDVASALYLARQAGDAPTERWVDMENGPGGVQVSVYAQREASH